MKKPSFNHHWYGHIISEGEGDVIEKVTYNEKVIDGYSITVKEFMQGGTLKFYKK